MAPSYRPNVCMLVLNRDDLLFLGERRGESGVWQFPQGGAEPEHTDEENVLKELYEELGAEKRCFQIMKRLESTHRYEFSKPRKYRGKMWDGQDQSFWLVRFKGKDSDIKLDRFEPEMMDFRWCTIEEVRKLAEPKRLKGYDAPLEEVREILLRQMKG
jgi:putative (di)nucleoside polyphosphate hydrolase